MENVALWHWEIWDRETEINGCAPDVVISEHRIKDEDEVYLIMKHEQTVMIQTNRDTPHPADTIEESAELHLQSILDGFEASEEEHAAVSDLQRQIDELKALLGQQTTNSK